MAITLPTWCPWSETLRNMTVGTAYTIERTEVNIIDFNLIFPILFFLVYFTVTDNNHRGSQLYFNITRYVLKEEGRTLFLLPKVKVKFRYLFSLQKRFSLCSSHKINANIDIFRWLTGLQWNTLVFKFKAVRTTSYPWRCCKDL